MVDDCYRELLEAIHRLAVARYTNRILVLQGGVLIEEGDHDSLMKKNGVYASMYHAQSHWYAQDEIGVREGIR
jgi:ATP-binding cassette subfamily B protein